MRPHITCHMASSIDGKLLASRWSEHASGDKMQIVMSRYEEAAGELGADGFMIGSTTMEEFDGVTVAEAVSGPVQVREPHVADRGDGDVAVIFDRKGKLRYERSHIDGSHIVAVLSERVPDDYLETLRSKGFSYLFSGSDGADLASAMETLAERFKLRHLLLEGGGRINGEFLKASLIDEFSLIIYPGIDGLAGMPSIVDYVGMTDELPAAGKSLRHVSTDTLEGGMVWIRYRFETNSPA